MSRDKQRKSVKPGRKQRLTAQGRCLLAEEKRHSVSKELPEFLENHGFLTCSKRSQC
jgi:hypothetical protein